MIKMREFQILATNLKKLAGELERTKDEIRYANKGEIRPRLLFYPKYMEIHV